MGNRSKCYERNFEKRQKKSEVYLFYDLFYFTSLTQNSILDTDTFDKQRVSIE
jgi:hypothetical protein